MANEEMYEPDIISVNDEDGNEILFELLERYETDDDVYVAIILKVVTDDNGDEYLEEIQDEMEYEQVSDILMSKVEEKFDVEYFEPEQ